MNTYSRALRHISMKDVKQKHRQKLIEQKIQEEREQKEKEYIASVMEEKKYDWREKLNEQMTTSNLFFSTLPATGDINLANPEWNVSGGYNYNVSGGTVTITNSGTPGPESGFVSYFDTSLYDTLVIDVGVSGDTLLGIFDSSPNQDPILFITTSGTYSVPVLQSKNDFLLFLSATLSVGTVTINNLRFQRRTPLNVFIPLDSPEATSFVRTGSGDLSPAEKQKKLKEMLEASDEYVQKMYGDEFPGSGAVPPGEAGDIPGVEIAQIQPIEPAQQRKGTTGVGVPDTKNNFIGPLPYQKMNYPKEWLPKQA